MTPRDRELTARLSAVRAGLRVDAEKAYLIESRLAPVARREGFGSVDELLHAVREREEERLIWAVVEAMTLAETCFFRDPGVFDRLRDEVLPELAARREGEPIRIWSAACGSGQEVYSLAMMLAEARPAGAQVELFASDLSERQLEKAQSGLYTQFEVQRGLAARQLVRHFEKHEEMFALSPRIRQSVRWRRVNLVEDIARLGQFDLILCRYVLGSLIAPARARVAESLAAALRPGGRLVLGLGEEVDGLAPSLQPLPGDRGFYAVASGVRAAA